MLIWQPLQITFELEKNWFFHCLKQSRTIFKSNETLINFGIGITTSLKCVLSNVSDLPFLSFKFSIYIYMHFFLFIQMIKTSSFCYEKSFHKVVFLIATKWIVISKLTNFENFHLFTLFVAIVQMSKECPPVNIFKLPEKLIAWKIFCFYHISIL